MVALRASGIATVLGRDIDAQALAAIVKMEATAEELTEALSRLVGGEVLGTYVMAAPGSRIDRLCEILNAAGLVKEDEHVDRA